MVHLSSLLLITNPDISGANDPASHQELFQVSVVIVSMNGCVLSDTFCIVSLSCSALMNGKASRISLALQPDIHTATATNALAGLSDTPTRCCRQLQKAADHLMWLPTSHHSSPSILSECPTTGYHCTTAIGQNEYPEMRSVTSE